MSDDEVPFLLPPNMFTENLITQGAAMVNELRDLNERVAHKVMGLVPCKEWKHVNFGSAGGAGLIKECIHGNNECYPTASVSRIGQSYDGVPDYSGQVAMAFEVVERMREQGWTPELSSNYPDPEWDVAFQLREKLGDDIWRSRGHGEHSAVSLPEAICRAALKAIGDKSK